MVIKSKQRSSRHEQDLQSLILIIHTIKLKPNFSKIHLDQYQQVHAGPSQAWNQVWMCNRKFDLTLPIKTVCGVWCVVWRVACDSTSMEYGYFIWFSMERELERPREKIASSLHNQVNVYRQIQINSNSDAPTPMGAPWAYEYWQTIRICLAQNLSHFLLVSLIRPCYHFTKFIFGFPRRECVSFMFFFFCRTSKRGR